MLGQRVGSDIGFPILGRKIVGNESLECASNVAESEWIKRAQRGFEYERRLGFAAGGDEVPAFAWTAD